MTLIRCCSEVILHIPKSSRITGTSPSYFLWHIQDTHWWGGVLPFCREAVGVFYNPSRLGKRRVSKQQFVFVLPIHYWLVLNTFLIFLNIDLRPSCQSRNRCIRSKISRYNLDHGRVEFGAIATPTGSRCSSNNYITWCHRQLESELESVSCSSSCSSSCSENQLPAGSSGSQDPRLSSPAE